MPCVFPVLAIKVLGFAQPGTSQAQHRAAGWAYTVGVVFFVLDHRIRYAHTVWHGFVAAGTGLHVVAIMGYAG